MTTDCTQNDAPDQFPEPVADDRLSPERLS